ncbi:MAG: HTH domain-containing protein [Bacteroidaceae bacterium]|nr:HTH domain-containing protein [Bacteroidaceae bacterium]
MATRIETNERNKNIAFAFFKAGFIDKWGLGYKRICEGFENAGLKQPMIELVDGGVRVTVWRSDDIKDVVKELSERQILIYDLIKEDVVKDVVKDVVITAATLAERFSVDERTIQRDLQELQKRGLIAREGGRKNGRWIVVA